MRKCCCCISVHVGASILGFLGFLICALELAVLIPYMLDIDPETFNPIKDNLDDFKYILEKTMEENKIDKDTIGIITTNIDTYSWPSFLGK